VKRDKGKNPAVGTKSKTHPVTWCVLALFILFVLFPFWMPFLAKMYFDVRVKSSPCWKLEGDEARIARIDSLIEEHSRKIGPITAGDGEIFSGFVGSVEHKRDVDGDGIEDRIGLESDHSLVISSSHRGREWCAGISDSPSGGTSVGFDDVDGDGFLDAWCCDPADSVFRVFYGNGRGKFRKKQQILGVWGYAKGAFFDVDDDGDLDVVFKIDHKVFVRDPNRATEYFWIQLAPKRTK
jgi:hypothetical protein